MFDVTSLANSMNEHVQLFLIKWKAKLYIDSTMKCVQKKHKMLLIFALNCTFMYIIYKSYIYIYLYVLVAL